MATAEELQAAARKLQVGCVGDDVAGLSRQERQVVVETPLTIDIKDVGAYTLMCTPCDLTALAVGFAFSEGLISSRSDIGMLARCPDDPGVIRMQLVNSPQGRGPERNLSIVSSCGICGSQDIEEVLASLPVVGNTLQITQTELTGLTDCLRQSQSIFKQTGGTHAAGIFRDGQMMAVCEDLGRHCALDKAIGTCLLGDIPTAGGAAVLSGRVSFEMVAKAARAGVELIAAVSAPSTLAIEAADRCNITLCGFVRGPNATVYCHAERVISSNRNG